MNTLIIRRRHDKLPNSANIWIQCGPPAQTLHDDAPAVVGAWKAVRS